MKALIMIMFVCLCLVAQGQVDTVYTYSNGVVIQEIVETLSRKTFIDNTEMVFSSDEAERLFRGGKVVRHDYSILTSVLTSVFPLPQTKRLFVYYVVEDSEVKEERSETNPETNIVILLFWVIIPCVCILLFGLLTPQENKRELLVFYGALIATTVLAMVAGYYAGGLAGGIVGWFAGVFAGVFAGGLAGVFAGGLAGRFAGFFAGVLAGWFAGFFAGTSDIWIVSQYLVVLLIISFLSYLLFVWKNRWKERQLRAV